MTHEELLAELSPPRLPAEMASLDWREFLAMAALGLFVGLVAGLLLRPVLDRKPSRRRLIRATRGQPGQERILSVARILGYLPEPLRPAAYGTAPPPSDAMIERLATERKRRR